MDRQSEVRSTVRQITDLLARSYGPDKVVLFGSSVSGSMDEESDVDLLIIKDTPLPFHRRGGEVRALLRPLRLSLPMDIIVLTPQELDAQLRRGNIFLETILREGEVLFERSGVATSGRLAE
ncbi:MAG: nucleotidyltransferase domain-containing protein [Anaerolineae bacterium]|nr:nucleotidyltransferase domain-containing protein [Anaerolineae bacterium]MCX7855906.1 nucleotidyltransferase domain-containing protein [Anaerolineae bacterium]MDW8068099.1 nucleotidyltransferase domain-containing protein [Anaerolineae bacterium]